MNVTRLINADDIPYAVNIDHPSGEYDYAYRCEVDAMHTVEAIPIEWMLKWDDAPLTDESKEIGSTVNWNIVKWMILEWRKEHEQID